MQGNDTTPPDYIQEWLDVEADQGQADSSTDGEGACRETAHNGNGQLDPRQPPAKPGGTWQPMTLAEYSSRPQADRSWLVDGLLPRDGLSLLVGSPKAGKSTLARCLATAVVGRGSPWLDRDVDSGTVLHLSLEERTDTVAHHYRMLEACGERIVLIEDPWPKPKDPAAKLKDLITKFAPVLVIIDPLIRCVSIRNTNDYAETSEALDPYINLARVYRTHILFVHHANKRGGVQGNEIMGSQAIAGSMDTILSLKHDGGQRRVQAWGRDGVEMPETQLVLEDNGWMGVIETTQAIRAETLRDEIEKVLREADAPVGKEELQKKLICRRQVLIEILATMVKDRKISEVKDGRKTLYTLFES